MAQRTLSHSVPGLIYFFLPLSPSCEPYLQELFKLPSIGYYLQWNIYSYLCEQSHHKPGQPSFLKSNKSKGRRKKSFSGLKQKIMLTSHRIFMQVSEQDRGYVVGKSPSHKMHETRKPAKGNILELQERKHLRAGSQLLAMPHFLASIQRASLVASDWVYLAPFPGRTVHSGHSSSCTGTAQHWPACKENLAFVFVVTTFCGEKSRGEGCQLSLLCISMDLTFHQLYHSKSIQLI